jgi:hypothetical protein
MRSSCHPRSRSHPFRVIPPLGKEVGEVGAALLLLT